MPKIDNEFVKPWFWFISLTVVFQRVVFATQLTWTVVRIQRRVVPAVEFLKSIHQLFIF